MDLLLRLFRRTPVMTVSALLLAATVPVTLIGLAVDPATVTGAPVWMKPLKFGIATSVYCFNVAYLLEGFTRFPRLVRWMDVLLGLSSVIEVVLIDQAAARHVTSHFNVSSPAAAMVWHLMALFIGVVMLSNIVLAVQSFRQTFVTPAWGWMVRSSLVLVLISFAAAARMPVPTEAQMRTDAAHPHTTEGAHTVGAADGGPGLPVAGWSTRYGDLRVAHFLGLHAMQPLTLLALLLGAHSVRRRRQTLIVLSAAGAFAVATVTLLVQALRAEPLLHPDAQVAAMLVFSAALAVVAGWMLLLFRRDQEVAV